MNVAYIITSRRHVAEYEVGFLSCLHFAKRNSLYSEVILKLKQVIFWGNIFLNYDKSLIFCLIPAWILGSNVPAAYHLLCRFAVKCTDRKSDFMVVWKRNSSNCLRRKEFQTGRY